MGCYISCPMNKTELKTSKPAAAEVLNFFLQDYATSDMSSPSLVHKLKGTWASLSSITLVIFTSTSIWTSHRKDIGSSLQSSISIRHQTPCSSLIGNLLKTSINIDFHIVRIKRLPHYTSTLIFSVSYIFSTPATCICYFPEFMSGTPPVKRHKVSRWRIPVWLFSCSHKDLSSCDVLGPDSERSSWNKTANSVAIVLSTTWFELTTIHTMFCNFFPIKLGF